MARYQGLASVRTALSLPKDALLEIKPEAMTWQWAQAPPDRAREALAIALTAIDGRWKLYISLPDDPDSNVLEVVGLSRTADRSEPLVLDRGGAVTAAAVAPLRDGRLEVWLVTLNGLLFSTWQADGNSRPAWAPWFDFLAYRGGLPAPVRQVAMANLSNGALESWVVTTGGGLYSTWKVSADPGAEWAPWFDFLAYRGSLPSPVRQVAMGRLSNGALESWVVTADGGLYSTWKESADPAAEWAPWFDFLDYRGSLPSPVRQVAMGRLSNGALESWVVTADGGLYSTWKESADPAAEWAPWFDFLAYRGGLPAPVRQVAMAPLSDRRLAAWVVLASGAVFTASKTDTNPAAEWTSWTDFLVDV
jgi:hypothetical protein